MSSKKVLKLSSSWTNVGLYGSALMCLIAIPLLGGTLLDQAQKFHFGMVIGPAVFLAFVGFVIYQFIYVCDARLVDDKLILKKKFRPAKTYTFDQIGYPSSFRLKRTKYITVEMTNEDKSVEKYMIINSNSLLSFENKDAEDTLIQLRTMARMPK